MNPERYRLLRKSEQDGFASVLQLREALDEIDRLTKLSLPTAPRVEFISHCPRCDKPFTVGDKFYRDYGGLHCADCHSNGQKVTGLLCKTI